MKKLTRIFVAFGLCLGASNVVLATGQDGAGNPAKVGALVAVDMAKPRAAGVDAPLLRTRVMSPESIRPEQPLQKSINSPQTGALIGEQQPSDNPLILLAGLGLIGVIAIRRLSS